MSPKGTTTGIWTGGAFSAASGTGTVTVSFSGYESGTGTLYGPDGTTAISGDTVLSEAPAGAYWMEWDDVTDYLTPAVAYGNLSADGTLTLSGTYVALTDGPEHTVVAVFKDDLANLSQVRTFLGVSTVAAAKLKILVSCEEGDADTVDALRPFIMLHYGDDFGAEKNAGGSQNYFDYGGNIWLMFEKDTNADYVDDASAAMIDFMKEVGRCLDGILSVAAQGGKLPTTGLRRVESPWRIKESQRKKRDYHHVDYVVEWGV